MKGTHHAGFKETLAASEAAAHVGSVGRQYPHVEVCIADVETGLPLQGETTGELWVRGPSVFAGYLGDAEATARAMRGEWLRTGDLAQRDAEGWYRIVDRLKDIYISGGENVAPAEVEYALGLHSLVESAAVVGVPDPVWGSGAWRTLCSSLARRSARTSSSRTRGATSPRTRCPCGSFR